MRAQLPAFIALTVLTTAMVRTGTYQEMRDKALDLVYEVEAKHDLAQIAREVDFAQLYERAPDPYDFSAFVSEEIQSYNPSKDTSLDPWGHPYRLSIRRDTFVVASLGADGRRGTDDDIAVEIERLPSAARY